MSKRAVFIAFTAVVLLSLLAYSNDFLLHQEYMIGTYLPMVVFGGLLISLLAIGPALKLIGFKKSLSSKEYAFILAVVLFACYIPGGGLMGHFFTIQIMPHYHVMQNPTKQQKDILNQAPRQMLLDVESQDPEVLARYLNGQDEMNKSDLYLPWKAWLPNLLFWLPLVLLFSFAMVGLGIAVHKQWSRHEQLPYPIAAFGLALIEGVDGDDKKVPIHKTRGFWIGACSVMVFHLSRYLTQWFPEHMVGFSRYPADFTPLLEILPLMQLGGAAPLFNPVIFFTVIGFSFFLSSDVSFSIGASPFVYALVSGLFLSYGINLGGGFMEPTPMAFMNAGSFAGILLIIFFAGRNYYTTLLKRSLWIDKSEIHQVESYGLRLFFLCNIMIFFLLLTVGVDWLLAIIYLTVIAGVFLVVSRIVAETGSFQLHTYFFPCMLIWGFFGERALGTDAIFVMMMLTSMLAIDPRQSMLPYVATALKISDDRDVKLKRVFIYGSIALVLAFAVALPVTYYTQYKHGVFKSSSGWFRQSIPKQAIQESVRVDSHLKAIGADQQATPAGLSRLWHMRPDKGCLIAFLICFSLVILCYQGRFRFSKWPIHPIFFAILGTWQSKMMGVSFLIGWLLKVMIARFGGHAGLRIAKPVMIGFIAGEILSAVIPMIIGAIYYFSTGEAPPRFKIMIGS